MVSLRHILLLALVFSFFAISASALGDADFTDNWVANGGTSTDAAVWGGFELDAFASGVNSNADCLCWDWCDGGSPDSTTGNWDACYCKTGKLTQCKDLNPSLSSICNVAAGGCAEVTSLSSDHSIPTGASGDQWKCSVDVKEYVDCDNSSSQKATNEWMDVDGDPFYVVSPKLYDCDDSSSQYYDFEGTFASGSNVDILDGVYCGQYYACDEDNAHINHDDVLITSATGTIPYPCSLLDGATGNYACSTGAQCLSGVCDGGYSEVGINCGVGGDGSVSVFGDLVQYQDTCGGAGAFYSATPGYYSGSCSSGKVCDSDFAYYTSSFTTTQICKTQEYGGCSASSQCWNENSGYVCMGSTSIGSSPNYNRICTTGSNGKQCFNNDDLQCDSGRCDATCQAKLADGGSCNEASDCSSGTCTGGVCGGGGTGTVCTQDIDCQSKQCVYESASVAKCVSSYEPFVQTFDTYDSSVSNSYSSDDDGVAFTSYTVKPVVFDLKQSTDMLCYDFGSNGTYDKCYYDTGKSAGVCNYFSVPSAIPDGEETLCELDDYFGCLVGTDVPSQICSGGSCNVNTNNVIHEEVRVKAFYDCANNFGLREEEVVVNPPFLDEWDDYWVVNPKYFYCANQTSPGLDYFAAGDYGPNYDDAIGFGDLLSCAPSQSCSILADEQYISTATGTIPSACKTNPTGSCTQNSDCLYNSCNTSTNQCDNGFIYESFIWDALGNPLPNYTVKLTTCTGSVLQTTVTDSDGKFVFGSKLGSYGLKLQAPWGDVEFGFESGYCQSFPSGFTLDSSGWVFEKTAVLQGKAITPDGDAQSTWPFSVYTCQDDPNPDSLLASTTTNTSGDFLLTVDSGKHVLKTNYGGYHLPLTDVQGTSCLLDYGPAYVGTFSVSDTCSDYDNFCSDNSTLWQSCTSDPVLGCSCVPTYCANGCVTGAPECNPVGTGTLKINVMNSGNPVKNASIQVDGIAIGKTNSLGKLEVNAKHGSHSVKATCLQGTPSQSKSVYLSADYQFVNINLNCPVAQEKGDLYFYARMADGNPVANVYVFNESEELVGSTDGFGLVILESLEYGSHPLYIRYKSEVTGKAYQITYLADVNQTKSIINIPITTSGSTGISSFSVSEIDASVFFLPYIVIVALPIVTTLVAENAGLLAQAQVAGILDATDDFCSCALKTNPSLLVSACEGYLGENYNATTSLPTFSSAVEGYVYKLNNSIMKQCAVPTIFLALSLDGLGPEDLAIFGSKGLAKKAGEEGVEGLSKITSEAGKKVFVVDGVKHEVKWTGELWELVVKLGLSDLTEDGAKAALSLAKKIGVGGEDKLVKLIGQTDGYLLIDKKYLTNTINGMGKLQKNMNPIEYSKMESGLAKVINDTDFGNIKGSFGEVEVFSTEFSNKIAKWQYTPVGASHKAEALLIDDALVEVRTIALNSISYPSQIQEINILVAKVSDWVKYSPSSDIHLRFTNPISDEIKADLIKALEKIENINMNKISISVTNYS